jgi:hypothetical protein
MGAAGRCRSRRASFDQTRDATIRDPARLLEDYVASQNCLF